MVKRRINTIFGVICVVIIVVVVRFVSRQPCPTKDTAGSANTDPQATQNKTLPHKQQTNATISCQVPLQAPAGHNRPTAIPTMATQRCRQTLVPLSWSQNQKWHQQRRWPVARAKPQQATLSPRVNDALGASYWWQRWWGRRGRSDGVTKG